MYAHRPAAESPTPVLADPRFQDRERQPGLDLLRAIAIVIVVIYHTGIFGFALPYRWHRFGWIGVDLFFVLSGYLIGGQLLASLKRDNKIAFGRFFARRALRILPAYFAVLAIYFLLPWLREFQEISPAWKFILSVQNIGLRGGTAFSHAWSLAIEDQFYLALPLVLLFVWGRKRAGIIVPCLVVLGGIALRAFLAWKHPGANGGVSFRGYQLWIYYPTWTRLDPLLFGVVLSAIEQFRPQWWIRLMDSARWLWFPGLALIVFGLYLGEGEILTLTACTWQLLLIALGMAALVICGISPRLPFRHLRIPGVALIASVAYSVYLSHKLVIHAVIQFCSAHNIPLKSVSAILLVEICIYSAGFLLYLAIERPFLQIRHRIAPRARAQVAA